MPAGGELAGLRGRLAAHTEAPADAGMWYRLALSLATEADESRLAGWILGIHSIVPTASGDHGEARDLISRGLELTSALPTSPTRAWLFALAARAEAALGRPDQARQALGEAAAIRGAPAPGERRGPIGFEDDEVFLGFYEGVALKLAGDLSRAEEALDTSLARRPRQRGRHKGAAVVHLEKADLHLRGGQPDEAAHLAATALEALPREEVIAPIVSRVDQLRAGLRPWSDATAVRRLEETWAALTG